MLNQAIGHIFSMEFSLSAFQLKLRGNPLFHHNSENPSDNYSSPYDGRFVQARTGSILSCKRS